MAARSLFWILLGIWLILPLSSFGDEGFNIEDFQAPSGGYRLKSGEPESIEATHYALFLSSLFGLGKRINAPEISNFIQSLENGDNGYGRSAGGASDLESVWHALLSYQHLGTPVPNVKNGDFIQSLFDRKNNLFANRAGENGDLKSTVFAFQALEILEAGFLKEITPSLKEYLKSAEQTKDGQTYFAFSSLSPVAGNYYGTLLGSYVGYSFGDVTKRVAFIAAHQSTEGGFYGDDKSSPSLEASAQAALTLSLLQKQSSGSKVFDKINVATLTEFASSFPYDLKSAAFAQIIKVIVSPSSVFDTSVSYETAQSRPIVDDRIVQGTSLKPVVSIKNAGGAHGGFSVEVDVTIENQPKKNLKLKWNDASSKYVTEEAISTENLLGSATFDYSYSLSIPDLDDISFTLQDVKKIGYGITIASEAKFAGKEIKEGEDIGVDTHFNFGVTLSTQAQDNLVTGDFEVSFKVLDSSALVITQQTVDGKENDKPLKFAFTLTQYTIPAGPVTFLFEVKNSKGVHTSRSIQYIFSIPMVASEISFEGVGTNAPVYKIGDTVKISFVPGSFPDYRTVHPLAHPRNFLLDIKSPSGTILQSLKGTTKSEGNKIKYSYSFAVGATLDSLGTNAIAFRYVPASGDDIVLSNYDSVVGELFDTKLINYTVKTELHLFNVEEKPVSADFFYGNNVNFKFQIKDTISNSLILPGKADLANVFLSLRHENSPKSGKFFTSVHQPASLATNAKGEKVFVISWSINPNAVSGEGTLHLVAQDADGNSLHLYKEGAKEDAKYAVTVGGTIEPKSKVFVSSKEGPETVFVVSFSLSCQGRILKDAQLQVVVAKGDKQILVVPVASLGEGNYQVSFLAPHEKVPAGTYSLQFYRESDRVDRKGDVKALFQIEVYNEGVQTGLPVRTEFLVLLGLVAIFFVVSQQRAKYGK